VPLRGDAAAGADSRGLGMIHPSACESAPFSHRSRPRTCPLGDTHGSRTSLDAAHGLRYVRTDGLRAIRVTFHVARRSSMAMVAHAATDDRSALRGACGAPAGVR